MSITSAEILYKLSGGASNSTASNSLGGAASSTNAPGSLFNSITAAEASAGTTKYRCIYVDNTDASITLTGAVLWITSNTPSASTDLSVGIGTAAMNAAEQTVANETTAPTGVTFSAPSTKAGGIALGDIPAGQVRSIWLKYNVTAGAAATSSDPFTIRVEGSTT